MTIPLGLALWLAFIVALGTVWMLVVTWMLSKVWTFYCDMPDPPKKTSETEVIIP